MINTFINSYKVSFAEGANHFVHFLRRIPLIGKHISEGIYRETKAKLILGIVKEVFSILFAIITKALYLASMVYLPASLIAKDEASVGPIFIHILFFLNFIIGPVIRDVLMDKTDKKGFLMIVLMREEPRNYYLSQIIFRNFKDFICFLLPIILIGLMGGVSPLKAITLLVELIAFRFIVEGIILLLWEKTKKVKGDCATGSIIIIGLLLAYAMPAVLGPINFQTVLFNGLFIIGVVALAIAAFAYMFKYNQYKKLSRIFINKENVFEVEATIKNLEFADVQINDKKMDTEDLKTNLFDKKTGYDYLNALFFHRHRRIMVKPMKNRLYIISAIFLITAVVLIFAPISNADKEEILAILPNSTPTFVFWMYVISTGERSCKAMFYNCDASLLRYAFYREPKVILSNFTLRIKKVLVLNLIPAVAICLALTGMFIICGGAHKLMSMVPLFLCIICLAAFFSIHHLFMYYVIQPYTAELTIKSPAFKIVSGIIYVLCWACLNIETSSYYFTLGVSAVTIIYMIVALIVTYKVAPKAFRLK